MPSDFHLLDNLAEDLVREGLITQDQLTVARVSQQNLGEDLGRILIKRGFLTEDQLLSFMGRSLSIPYVRLEENSIQRELVQKVPLHLAKRYHLIPLRRENNRVIVAMANPLDRFAVDELHALLHAEIFPVIASLEDIQAQITQHYALQKTEKGRTEESIEMLGYYNEESPEAAGERLEKIAAGPKIIQLVNEMIVQAYHEKASDIHLEPRREAVAVRYRIDGFLEEKKHLAKEILLPLVSRIKILGGLDIAERRIPQDGRTRMRIGGSMLDLRVATFPTLYGEKVVLRLLSKDTAIGIDSLGFSENDRKVFSELISRSHGIFLVTGPTGSGKSTTLYAALSQIDTANKNVISVEDPIESEIAGVNQSQINPKAGVTFASSLRAILRQDPDVIMIGEIRDAETAEIAVRAAITGHLVLSTLHTNTAAGAISRLNDLGVEPFLLSSAMIGVLAQRLVRKICPVCREEAEMSASDRLGPLASKVRKFFRGRGCPACRMSGYSGRIGIFELAPIGDNARRLIADKATDQTIEEEFRKVSVRSILEDGLEKVEQGITTVDELLRVTQED